MRALALSLSTALLLALSSALSGCESSGTSATSNRAQINNEIVATAKVTAIDAGKRLITMRREDGSLFRVMATDAVRNFDQIAVGDSLRVQYREMLVATKLAAGEEGLKGNVALTAARAERGDKPGGGVSVAASVSVKIESVDRDREVVVFSLASGELIARHVVTDEGRAFIKGLKTGDRVQLDYTEVLALSVEKL